MKLGTFRRAALMLAGSLAAAAAVRADRRRRRPPPASLNIPDQPRSSSATDDPNVRKATAIVNGDVITGTDVDQRLALIVARQRRPDPARGAAAAARSRCFATSSTRRSRSRPPRQATSRSSRARSTAISRTTPRTSTRRPSSSPPSCARAARPSARSSGRSTARWPGRGCSAARSSRSSTSARKRCRRSSTGSTPPRARRNIRVGEIFLSATPETAAEARANAAADRRAAPQRRLLPRLCAPILRSLDRGGRRRSRLGPRRAAARGARRRGRSRCRSAAISDPIAIPGGFSIVAVAGHAPGAHRRPARRGAQPQADVGQLPAGHDPRRRPSRRSSGSPQTSQTMGGCGGAEAAAATIGAEVVTSDQVKVRDLPPAAPGDPARSSASARRRRRSARSRTASASSCCAAATIPTATAGPSFDQVYAQLDEERVNRRARRYLRDLRRDAVVDYR